MLAFLQWSGSGSVVFLDCIYHNKHILLEEECEAYYLVLLKIRLILHLTLTLAV